MNDFSKLFSLMLASVRGEMVVLPVGFPMEQERALARGDVRPEKAIQFRHHQGRRLTDYLRCGFRDINLISDRFLETLQANSFTGWRTFPVEVLGKEKQILSGYAGLAVTGRCGPIDNTKSERKILPAKWPAVRAVPAWYGLYFDLSTWDGSDLFMPEETGFVFVTEAVKCALEEAKLTNIHFTKLTEFERLVL